MFLSGKSKWLLAVLVCIALIASACGGKNTGSNSNSSNSGAASNTEANDQSSESSGEKVKLTLMFAWPDDTLAAQEEQMVLERFGDKYDITFKPVDGNIERTIKTTISTGDPVDLAFFWTTNMQTFVNSDMALDLTPYLEENNGEWKNTFIEGTLDGANFDGKIYAVPNTPVYPLILANKDLLDQAGVTISDSPTWDEFMDALASVKEKLGITPLGISNNWANWPLRNNLTSIWPDDAKLDEWASGKLSFSDPTVLEAFNAAKEIYDKEYAYPGKGALTVTLDQVKMAFQNKQIAFMVYINYQADQAIKESGLQNIQIISFPYMGPEKKIMGSFNGYMIPANAKHPEASIEILKFLTSPEVLQNRVDNGSPVPVKGVTITDPKVEAYAKDSGAVVANEIIKISPKIDEYFNNKLPANYVFDPQKTLDELEKLRLEAVN